MYPYCLLMLIMFLTFQRPYQNTFSTNALITDDFNRCGYCETLLLIRNVSLPANVPGRDRHDIGNINKSIFFISIYFNPIKIELAFLRCTVVKGYYVKTDSIDEITMLEDWTNYLVIFIGEVPDFSFHVTE